ncbi:MAG TPA: YoaK family protein [bacterium]|nr:YoaK family protein [bacterium]
MSGPPDLGAGPSAAESVRSAAKEGPAPSAQVTARRQGRRAVSLALIAGYVDAYAFVKYRLYVSFMSGNTTQTASQAGQARFTEAGHNLFPTPCFVIGVFVGTVLAHSNPRHPSRIVLGVVAAILALGIAASFLPSLSRWVSIMLLSMAMGTMSTTITRVGDQAVSVSYVTGSLTNMMQHVALAVRNVPLPRPQGSWDTHGWRARLLASVWTAFFIGALLAGVALPRFGAWTLFLPISELVAMAAVARTPNPTG